MTLGQGLNIKQTAQENPFLTQLLTASILIMTGTLIGRARLRRSAQIAGFEDFEIVPSVKTKAESNKRIRVLRKLGCKVEVKETPQGRIVFRTCPPGTRIPSL